jgi:hypothetical protein
MRVAAGLLLALLAGCAALEPAGAPPPSPRLPAAQVPAAAVDCRPQLDKMNAQLEAEVAERQRVVRAAARREEALRKQLDALKSIERGILEREERMQIQKR